MRVPFLDEDFKSPSICVKFWPPFFACVSVAITPEAIGVRDTKDATKTTLVFTHEEWSAFIDGVKKGEFDISR